LRVQEKVSKPNASLNKHIATVLNVAEVHSIIRKSDPE